MRVDLEMNVPAGATTPGAFVPVSFHRDQWMLALPAALRRA
jgi:hypothetical protein